MRQCNCRSAGSCEIGQVVVRISRDKPSIQNWELSGRLLSGYRGTTGGEVHIRGLLVLPTSGASAEALVSFIVDLVKDNQNNRDILTETLAALELHCARSAGLGRNEYGLILCISSPAALGKMAITNGSMASCGMNCSTASCSTHWPRPGI